MVEEPQERSELNGEDFISQDPVELDDPEELGDEPTAEAHKENKDEESTVKGRQKESEEEYEEAVALDETEEESQDEASEEGGIREGDGDGEIREKESKVPLLRRNLALFAVTAFGMIFVAAGLLLGSRLNSKESLRAEQEVIAVHDPGVKQKLAPFYIPIKFKDKTAIAKIDIMVSWSRICSIRFKEARYQIRADIYDFLRGSAAKEISPVTDKALFEEGVTKVLNKALGVNTVKVSSMEVEPILKFSPPGSSVG